MRGVRHYGSAPLAESYGGRVKGTRPAEFKPGPTASPHREADSEESSGISGNARLAIEIEVAVAHAGGVQHASHTSPEQAKPQRGHVSACTLVQKRCSLVMLGADRVAEITANGPRSPKLLARIRRGARRSELSHLWRSLPAENRHTGRIEVLKPQVVVLCTRGLVFHS